MPNKIKPHVLIIGAGFTGCATAHDLALRGFSVTVVERGEISSGTSGRTHGLLHSGARYCMNDQESAKECIQENITLRKIARQCIEYNGGFFVALNDDDFAYAAQFFAGAEACGIPVKEIPVQEALHLEPNLNPLVKAVYLVPDGVFDPLRLALAFATHARTNGAQFLPYHEVKELILRDGTITGIRVWDRTRDQNIEIGADMVVNATGAWAGQICKMGNVHVDVTPTPGVMVAFDQRLTNRAINRLNLPGDGDILIPQRRMSVIGTTSFEVQDVDYIPVIQDQVQQMVQDAAYMVPAIKQTKIRGTYMSARPLVGSSLAGRSLARTFKVFDHQETEKIEGFITITGGKATTCRAMAEKAADLVCKKMGLNVSCQTSNLPLVSYRKFYS